MSGVPVVSVVIPARDEEQVIAGCLQALRGQSVGAARMQVVVVVAGTDQTAAIATREGSGQFGRFEVVHLETGNKNVALQVGCRHVQADVVVLLDADTEPEFDAIAELLHVLASDPHSVVHGAALPRIDTWVSRYWELNRKLVKDLHFDGNLSGEMVALPRPALAPGDLMQLFPFDVSAQDDLHLGRMLRQRGWRIVYAPRARATTLAPWTLRGLVVTMLRSRRGLMRILPLFDAATQAAKSALLVAAVPAAWLTWRWSKGLAFICLAPLLLHAMALTRQVDCLRQRRLGDFRPAVPAFLALDLVGRGLKLWAFVERLAGRTRAVPFRGERPSADRFARASAS